MSVHSLIKTPINVTEARTKHTAHHEEINRQSSTLCQEKRAENVTNTPIRRACVIQYNHTTGAVVDARRGISNSLLVHVFCLPRGIYDFPTHIRVNQQAARDTPKSNTHDTLSNFQIDPRCKQYTTLKHLSWGLERAL